MQNRSSIQYITRDRIDAAKWDACVLAASNSLIYARSWWLDSMAVNWDGLVLNDYEAVMPLPWNRKYGIKYLYQPPFTQQLGIFSRETIPETLTESFLNKAAGHFKFAELCLNYKNPFRGLDSRPNFVLPLNQPYESLYNNYKAGLKKSLKKAANSRLCYKKDFPLSAALDLNKEVYGSRIPHLTEAGYERFKNVCVVAAAHRSVILRAVSDQEEKLQSVALLMQAKGRISLLQSTTVAAGKKTGANQYLLDNIIKEFSGKPVLLDLEGSAIPGIAHYYKSFGSVSEPYFFYQHNKLPWLVKLAKSIYRMARP